MDSRITKASSFTAGQTGCSQRLRRNGIAQAQTLKILPFWLPFLSGHQNVSFILSFYHLSPEYSCLLAVCCRLCLSRKADIQRFEGKMCDQKDGARILWIRPLTHLPTTSGPSLKPKPLKTMSAVANKRNNVGGKKEQKSSRISHQHLNLPFYPLCVTL